MINSSCKMAINRCHLPSSSTTAAAVVADEVRLVLTLSQQQQHSKSGFNRLAQCQKNSYIQPKYALLFLAVFLFLLLLAVIIALSFDRLSLANLSATSALLWSSSSSSADLPQKPPTFHPSASPSDDDLTSLRDSISHIRRQKAELLSWLNGSEFHQQQHQQIPLDLLVSSAEKGGGLGIFWSPTVEALLEEEKLLNFEDHESFASSLRNATVIRTEATGCGRSPNRLAILADGRRLCLRYRTNSDQIQGEYLSYLLAKALGFARRNLPPTVLLTFDPSSSLSSSNLNWAPEVAAELVTTTTAGSSARWAPLKQIVATAFVEHLTPAYIPRQFQQQAKPVSESSNHNQNPRLHPLPADLSALQGAKPVHLLQLAQWSDLLLFDYLTANVDRLVNNRVNAQWNEQSMRSAPVHNLLRQEEEVNKGDDQLKGSRLLFLDNESGLYHGYRLLGRFEGHHRALLASLCIFRRGTVQRLKALHQLGESGLSQALLSGNQLQAEKFEADSKSSLLPRANLSILRRRMGTLLQQVASCQRQFS